PRHPSAPGRTWASLLRQVARRVHAPPRPFQAALAIATLRPKRERSAAPAETAAATTSAAVPIHGNRPTTTRMAPPRATDFTAVLFSSLTGILSPSHPAETVNPNRKRATRSIAATGNNGIP